LLATPSTITLSILVALPAAFRIWVVTHPTPSALEPSPDTQHEQEPLYSIIAPLRGEARVVDQLLSTIERLNYPPEKLDVIIAVEAKDDATRAANHCAQTSYPHYGDPRSCRRPGGKTKGAQCRPSVCARNIHGDLRRRGQAGAKPAARRPEGLSGGRR
jgi:cellulose synthase/poly-beta-1,6-N-acetylglucosamine synthase-like glycosyltransferase